MKAGELRENIIVLRPTKSTSDYGGDNTILAEAFRCKAKIVYGRGFRAVTNNEILYQRSIYITIRKFNDVKVTDIIKWNDVKYQIITPPAKYDDRIEITAQILNE